MSLESVKLVTGADNVKAADEVKSEAKVQETKVDLSDPVDTLELSTKKEDDNKEEVKKEASVGKKIGVGVASACVSGLGQLINGETGKGAGFFLGSIASSLILIPTLGPIGALVPLGINIASIVDAVKNA